MIEDKKTLLVCSAAHAMNHMQILFLAALLPTFREKYELSFSATEAIISVYFLSYALLNPVTGVFLRDTSRKALVAVGKIVSGAALGAMAVLQGYAALLLIQIFYGSAGGIYHPAGTSILADRYGNQIRGKVMAVHGFGSSLGMVLAPVIIALFLARWDFRIALAAFSVLSILMGLIFLRFADEPKAMLSSSSEIKEMLRGAKFRKVLLAFALRDSIFWGVKAFLPLYAVAAFGFSPSGAAAVLALLPATGLLANPAGGYLADRFNRARLVQRINLALAVVLVLFYPNDSVTIFYLLILLTAFLVYATLPVLDSLTADVALEKLSSPAYGAVYGLGYFLGAVTPLCVGLISDFFEPRLGFLFLGLFALASSCAASRIESEH